MKRRRVRSRSPTPKKRTVRSSHVFEYLAILREHKWVAVVPFVLIVGGAIAMTLLATPVYQADALVAIEGESGGASLLDGLELTDTSAKVEAEMPFPVSGAQRIPLIVRAGSRESETR